MQFEFYFVVSNRRQPRTTQTPSWEVCWPQGGTSAFKVPFVTSQTANFHNCFCARAWLWQHTFWKAKKKKPNNPSSLTGCRNTLLSATAALPREDKQQGRWGSSSLRINTFCPWLFRISTTIMRPLFSPVFSRLLYLLANWDSAEERGEGETKAKKAAFMCLYFLIYFLIFWFPSVVQLLKSLIITESRGCSLTEEGIMRQGRNRHRRIYHQTHIHTVILQCNFEYNSFHNSIRAMWTDHWSSEFSLYSNSFFRLGQRRTCR